MNDMTMHLSEIVGLTILHSLWQITLVWIIIVAVLKLFPNASSQVRYTFAISLLMLCIIVVAATASYEWRSSTADQTVTPFANNSQLKIRPMDIAKHANAFDIISFIDRFAPFLSWIWCTGLIVMSTRFFGSFFYLNTLQARQNILPVSTLWATALERISCTLGLRRNVVIATSMRVTSPLTLGNFSPIILIPAGIASGMSVPQIEAILVHELYHIKRHDYLINIFQALAEVVFFYHPALWHINKIIRQEREKCCDDYTVAFCGNATMYARTLIQIQESNTLNKPCLAMSSNAGNFTKRIQRLFHQHAQPIQSSAKAPFAFAVLVSYVCVLLLTAKISTARQISQKDILTHSPVKTSEYGKDMSHGTKPEDAITLQKQLKTLTKKPAKRSAIGKSNHVKTQFADTTNEERSLEKCLQKVKSMLMTVNFNRFTTANGLQHINSPEFVEREMNKIHPKQSSDLKNLSNVYQSQWIDELGTETKFSDNPTEVASVVVYPNATNGPLNLSFTPTRNDTHVRIVLLDINGVIVREITNSRFDNVLTNLQVDLSNYSKGIYIVQMTIDDTTTQQRIVLQ